MTYKDKTFEINDQQIKFNNKTILPFIAFPPIILMMLAAGKTADTTFLNNYIGVTLGVILGLYILHLLTGIYLKNNIELSNIDYVRVHTWDGSIDKDRNFWGTGRYKYHFPAGLNRKEKPQVILVHIKNRKGAVGFVPENIDNVVSALKVRGITMK
jgi:hypothetical protein